MSEERSQQESLPGWSVLFLRSRRVIVWAVAGLVVAGLGSRALWPTRSHSIVNTRPVQDVDLDEPQAPEPGYLGHKSSAACHTEYVAEFQTSKHFWTCRVPRPEDMPPGFNPGKGNFTTRYPELRFEMTRQSNDLIQTAIHTTLAGEQRTTTHIDLAGIPQMD